MKKILIPFLLLIASAVVPLRAYAALECGSSFDNYASFNSVQSAQSCFAPDPAAPNPVLLDTSSNTYSLLSGQTISKPTGVYQCLPSGNTSVVGTVYSASDCNGQLFDSSGNPVTPPGQTTQPPQVTPTTPTYTASTPAAASGCTATTCYTPLEPLPGGLSTYSGGQAFAQYLGNFFGILLAFGAMVAIAMLVIGGVAYMMSESIGKKILAKERIQAALIGLMLLLGCYLILNTINPQLLTLSLVGPGIASAPSAAGTPATNNTPATQSSTAGSHNQITIQGDGTGALSANQQQLLQQYNENCALGGGRLVPTDGTSVSTTYTCQQ